jgi:hypothetical protein
MPHCRNCGSHDPHDLGFIGNVAPFFLKRVLGIQLQARISPHPLKRLLQKATAFSLPLLSRVHPVGAAIQMQSCSACSFIQTALPFADDALGRLYVDYRSDSYNRERSLYEPTYAAIAQRLGQHTESGLARVPALTQWLQRTVDLAGKSMLDFGGADGAFLPAFDGPRFVYEISDITPVPGVTRISQASQLGVYDYVQLSHVLEHVPHPRQMVAQVAACVAPGGVLLIEVPQDLTTAVIEGFRAGRIPQPLFVHEHINFYSLLAVQKLIEAAGLRVLSIEAVQVESPVTTQPYIRALATHATA